MALERNRFVDEASLDREQPISSGRMGLWMIGQVAVKWSRNVLWVDSSPVPSP
jgi:hypothetical protein